MLFSLTSLVLLLSQRAQAVNNPNLIFNALQSSLRHYESSINHNGMSLFVVTVPEGTPFYHGRHGEEIPSGLEWLAFTPEHALFFAMGRISPPPKRDEDRNVNGNFDRQGQSVLREGGKSQAKPLGKGYLHTYRTKRDLRFLYFDGISASKSDFGSLDIQNRLLLNITHNDNPHRGSPSLDNKFKRVTALCDLIEEEWDSQLAGLIRTEGDFEIVMCSFAKSLELVHRIEISPKVPRRGYSPIVFPPPRGRHNVSTTFASSPSSTSSTPSSAATPLVGQRNHDVAGSRAFIDFDSIMTAYAYPRDWPADNAEHNIMDWPDELVAKFRADAIAAIHKSITRPFGCETGEAAMPIPGTHSAGRPVHWRSVGDLIVTRFSTWLPGLLGNDTAHSTQKLLTQLLSMSAPFLDAADSNLDAETRRCTELYLPMTTAPAFSNASVAADAVATVARTICQVVLEAMHDLKRANDSVTLGNNPETAILLEDTREDVLGRVKNLIYWLDWTIWKKCEYCH